MAMNKEIASRVPRGGPGSIASRQTMNERLFCKKKRRYVDARNPRCQAPDEPCKYRTECVIYALQHDA